MQTQRVRATRSAVVKKLGMLGLILPMLLLLASSCDRGGTQYTVDSTAYCDQGQMADGAWVYDGAVAMNVYPGTGQTVPLGERFRIENGSLAGKVVTVEDRYGYGTQFDIWMSSCWNANNYGRRNIVVTDLGR